MELPHLTQRLSTGQCLRSRAVNRHTCRHQTNPYQRKSKLTRPPANRSSVIGHRHRALGSAWTKARRTGLSTFGLSNRPPENRIRFGPFRRQSRGNLPKSRKRATARLPRREIRLGLLRTTVSGSGCRPGGCCAGRAWQGSLPLDRCGNPMGSASQAWKPRGSYGWKNLLSPELSMPIGSSLQ